MRGEAVGVPSLSLFLANDYCCGTPERQLTPYEARTERGFREGEAPSEPRGDRLGRSLALPISSQSSGLYGPGGSARDRTGSRTLRMPASSQAERTSARSW